MADIKGSDNAFPSLLIQEAADDGSDFTNPAADYRRLFLGEDGVLHLKDSAGNVTAAGLTTGTSFPGTPSTGDLFHRTDLTPALWRYDGTRWLSEQVFLTAYPITNIGGGAVATTTNHGRLPIPYLGTFGLYLKDFTWLVVPAGVHDASNYYTAKTNWANQADSDTQIGATLDSKTATSTSNNYVFIDPINAVLSTDARELKMRLDKVASSPNLTYTTGTISFQLIAT